MGSLLNRNVATLVKAPAYRAQERDPFTSAEQAAILRVARTDRLYMIVVVAQATGLRQSELLGLRWADLDLERGVLSLRLQLGRDGILRRPKTAAGLRKLPLPRPVIQLLKEHRERQDQERSVAHEWVDHDLVTATQAGRPVHQRNAHRSWTRMLAKAGVRHRGIHNLRHAWVTMLAERGVHERVAQQLAGHADGRMTREIYTHVTSSMLDLAADTIEAAVGAVHALGVRGKGTPNGSPYPDQGAERGSGQDGNAV